jgi:NitT/TauT family transport system substrate-binding protein
VRHLVDADTAGRHDPPWSGVDDEPVAVIVAEGLPAVVGLSPGVGLWTRKVRGAVMAKFRISSHGRLQDWIAAEKGYFEEEGLDYEFDVVLLERSASEGEGAAGRGGDVRVGAYELYRAGAPGKRDMSCACHWAVNQAAADQHGRMWGHAYSVLPCGIYVAPESAVRRPADLAGVEVGVGYHSGSHFSAIQSLEAVIAPEAINLRFVGQPYDRIDALLVW